MKIEKKCQREFHSTFTIGVFLTHSGKKVMAFSSPHPVSWTNFFLLCAASGHVNEKIDCVNAVSVSHKQAMKHQAHLEQHSLLTSTQQCKPLLEKQ